MHKPAIPLLFLSLIVGCGGGGGNSLPFADGDSAIDGSQSPGEYSPGSRVVNACEAPYFSELTGRYGAQITYTEFSNGSPVPGGNQCVWEVDIDIDGSYGPDETFRQICFLTTSIESGLISSGSSNRNQCGDVDGVGSMPVPFNGDLNSEFWSEPVWPVDAGFLLQATLPEGQIFPIGDFDSSRGSRIVDLQFDGRGNIVFQDSISSDSSSWDGVFVKR